MEGDQEGVVWGSSQQNEAEEQQLEVANEWSRTVNSNYQLERMRNCFTTACFLFKAAVTIIPDKSPNNERCDKGQPNNGNYSNSKLGQTREFRSHSYRDS